VRKHGETKRRRQAAETRRETGLAGFPAPDRFTLSGKRVGDICFECECRILEIGGPDGMLLAWCDCGWPEDHGEMQIG
jgi:hypothetical protein